MTYSELITESLRMIGVLMYSESADANQAAQGISVLNDMMSDWEGDGIMLGYVPSVTPTDTLSMDPTAKSAVKANLAIKLCPFYERQPHPAILEQATSGKGTLMRSVMLGNINPVTMRHVPRGTGRWFDILTGLLR